MFSSLLQKCTSKGTNSHHSSQQQNRPFHCLAPSTTPISVKLLFLQLATSERCPDFSDERFSLASHLFIPWGRLSLCHWFLEQHCALFCFSKCLGTLKPLWKTRVPLSPPASLLCWPGLPGALLGLQLLTPTLPACGGFNDTRQHFHWDRFLQPCCHFSLPFVISSSTWTSWEGASPASAPEHHRRLCDHSMPWSACPVAGLEMLRVTGK